MFDFERDYWNKRYSAGHNSGYGSYGTQLEKKLEWLSGLPLSSISEVGCGDLNFAENLLRLYPHADYNGQDISEFIIEKNRKTYPEYNFVNEIDNLPRADLLLCIDVLFHIIQDSDVEAVLKKIEEKWDKYLAITAYEHDENIGGHVRIRKFDYERFGKPLIREIVEEDGQLYFYLFKKDSTGPQKPSIDLSNVTCCLITKDATYPKEILDSLKSYNFGEVLILLNSDSPYNKYKLFQAAKNDIIYYQDDDAICPVGELVEGYKPGMINVVMKPGHYKAYAQTRMTMGLGWGSLFSKSILSSLKKYTGIYGEDEVFKRETERILTYLNFPQNRLILPIEDLPSAWAEDRLYQQPVHNTNIQIVEERCAKLML